MSSSRRAGASATLASLALVVGACGVAGGDGDRAEVMARTCVALLERSGRGELAGSVEAADFSAALADYAESDEPFSTIQPLLRACPLRD